MISSERWARIVAAWPFDRRDGLVMAGFAALVYGIAQVSVPRAWMVAGGLLLVAWVTPLVLALVKKGR